MRIRHRLSLAFFSISVIPLAVVTAWSYHTSAAALRSAAELQADQMAVEMGERMTFALADLGDRVQRIWQARSRRPSGTTPESRAARPEGSGERRTPPAAHSNDSRALMAQFQVQVNESLAEAAPMIDRLEFAPLLDTQAGSSVPRPIESTIARPDSRAGAPDVAAPLSNVAATPPALTKRITQPPPRPLRDASGDVPEPGTKPEAGLVNQDSNRPDQERVPRPWFPPSDPEAPARVVVDLHPQVPHVPAAPGIVVFEPPSRDAIESWRKALQAKAEAERQWTGTGAGVPHNGDRRTGDEARNALREQARARRRAEFDARVKALASGEAVTFSVQMDGAVVGEVNARVNRHKMIGMVLGLARRERGEVPFVLDIDDEVHTIGAADAAVIDALDLDRKALASRPGQSSRTVGDWVVVTRHDQSGIVFGIARPLGDSLRAIRRSAALNLGLGLLLIGVSFAGILPLASSLTRPISHLTEGVQRLARGERGTRVTVAATDEVGQLAAAFNQMAGQIESHEKALVEQERLRRELELCRQIQVDMLPREPLRIGFAEVAGVSMPAREVGGDFFNYFGLPGGSMALVVGDVSGKGVGAALLMANIQATLRARMPLELDLPTLVDSLDRDVAENTPSGVYLTLFVAVLDPVRGLMRYVNGGHNPQYLLRHDGGLESMAATGLPVGLLPGRGYEQRSLRVHAGDLLFLYTDGATEAEDEAGEMFGNERLEAALTRVPNTNAAGVLAAMEGVLREFRGTAEPGDDATLMAVRLSS